MRAKRRASLQQQLAAARNEVEQLAQRRAETEQSLASLTANLEQRGAEVPAG